MKTFLLVLPFLIFSPGAFAAQVEAQMRATQPGSEISGVAVLEESEGGVNVRVILSAVPPGKHGIHIHENGSCADQGNAAGGHFNPSGVQHGLITKDGLTNAHPGDLGNFEANDAGKGELSAFVPGLSLTDGKYNVAGKSIVLHEKEDDFGQPTGNAGGRIACGVIERKS